MTNDEQHIDKDSASSSESVAGNENTTSLSALNAAVFARLGLGSAHSAVNATVDGLISTLEKSPQWQERTSAARRLAIKGEQEVIAPLEKALKDGEPAVRAAAARSLGELEEYAQPEPLIPLLRDADRQVRTDAALALGNINSLVSQASLVAIVNDPEESVRVAVVRALGALGEDTPIEHLTKALQDPAWQVREMAAMTLSNQGNRAPEEALIAVLDDESDFVCKAAVRSLGIIWQQKSARLLEVSAEEGPEDKSTPNEKKDDSGSGGQESSGTVSLVQTPASKQKKEGIHQKNGNVEFLGIDSGYFAGTDVVPIIAQALDNQWVPRSLLKSMLKGKITYREAEKYLEGLVRTEYIRSLINGERVIINRAYLYNNPSLFRDFLEDQSSRTTFKSLLDEGSIIPFLLYEHSPDETPAFDRNTQGFSAWEKVCQEVRMQCMRFSWDDGDQQTALRAFTNHFHNFTQQVEAKDLDKLVEDLGLNKGQLYALGDRLSEVTDTGNRYFREHRYEKSPFVTRNVLYKQFVTGGDNPALRMYDGSKPFAGEIKQLVDLAYNSQLADALNGYLLTPIDSPSRLILQDWESSVKQKTPVDGPTLFHMLRTSAFALFQEDRYLKSMGLLTLQDVHRVRQTEEWRNYIKSLQALLKTPLFFSNLADNVHRNYVALMRVTTALIEQRDKQRGGNLVAPWEPSVKVLATVGNASLSVVWNKDGTFYNFEGEVGKADASSVAPLSMKLTIGGSDSSSSNAQADLFSSIDIMQQKMHDAQKQWKDIMAQVRSDLMFKEYSRTRVKEIATPTINEQV